MYFCRCYNRDCQCRRNTPSACRTEKIIPKPEPAVVFKTASVGGVTLSDSAGDEKEYDLVFLDLDLPKKREASVEICFACNLILIRSSVDIRIQLVRAGGGPTVPVASPSSYRRTSEFSGADTIFFTVHDTAPVQGGPCCYLVKMYAVNKTPEDGMAAVTNPVLSVIALLAE